MKAHRVYTHSSGGKTLESRSLGVCRENPISPCKLSELRVSRVEIAKKNDPPRSSFARLRRADSEMKHVKNRDFFDMFLRRHGEHGEQKTLQIRALVRQAKLGVSYWVKVPVE